MAGSSTPSVTTTPNADGPATRQPARNPVTSHPFDPGPTAAPFAALATDYPGPEAYPAADFRLEWGPIFHRGRLDGSARILIIGQDPGQHESIARRILVGEAGQRVQGFLAKLGIERSYVMINSYLYSVYGQAAGERHVTDPKIVSYRHQWLDALLVGSQIEAVVAFGHLAREAFERWQQTVKGKKTKLALQALPHPTMPDASSGGNQAKFDQAMKEMLSTWNAGLSALDGELGKRDVTRPLVPYGAKLGPQEHAAIPAFDLPAGSPPWWSSLEQWATRSGSNAEAKRATIEVTVPTDERPWK
jgi:uracil-DNA glycosylase